MQFHTKPSQAPPNILKEGEGGSMGMNRERGGIEGSLVEPGKEDGNCKQDNLKFKLFAQKNLNITLFCKEI